jgi:hypothetical protein
MCNTLTDGFGIHGIRYAFYKISRAQNRYFGQNCFKDSSGNQSTSSRSSREDPTSIAFLYFVDRNLAALAGCRPGSAFGLLTSRGEKFPLCIDF